MKKIIISTLMLTANNTAQHYKPQGNFVEDYPQPVHFAINAFLAKTLSKDDDVKVILLKTSGGANAGDQNTNLFMDELNEINKSCGAKVQKTIIIDTQFDLAKTEIHKTFLSVFKELEYDAHIYSDLTYGHKVFPILLMGILQFAEKYYNAKIENIIYGKVEFDKDHKIIPDKSGMFDVSSMYGFTSLTNIMKASTAEKAIKAIDIFFNM